MGVWVCGCVGEREREKERDIMGGRGEDIESCYGVSRILVTIRT